MGCKWFNTSPSNEVYLQNQPSQVKAGGKLKSSNKGETKSKTLLNYKNASTITCPSQIDSLTQVSENEIAVGFSNGNISIYKIDSPQVMNKIYTLQGHSGTIRTLLKTNDNRLASGSGDSTIKIWRLYERMLDIDIKSHSNWVTCLLQLNNSDLLISGSSDCTIKLFNLFNKGALEHTFTVEKNVDCLVDIGDNLFASNCGDSIIIWDILNKNQVASIEGAFSTIVSMCYMKSERLLFTGAVNGTVKGYVIENEGKGNKKVMTLKDKGNLNKVLLFNENEIAVAIGNTIKVWDINEKNDIVSLDGHDKDIRIIIKMKEDDMLISGGEDNKIKIWI